MKYLLRKSVIDRVPEIEISEEQYQAYKAARKVLSSCFAIEEIYEILVSNYLEFEKQILTVAATNIVRNQIDYSDFFEAKLGINICLVNFLTAARLYIDQLNSNVQDCVLDQPNIKESVERLFSKEYDTNFEYRFMEALRNYVQHRGIPLHWISQGSKRTALESNGLFEFSVEIASQRSLLEEDGKFKKAVLEETSDKIDLKSAARGYMESIGNVHDAARQIIDPAVNNARSLLEDAHKQYAAVFSESLLGLSAYAWSDGSVIDVVPLLLNWDDVRVALKKRNGKMTNLRKKYVTGIIRETE